MSHVGSGHTDAATINERRPLTPGMLTLLRRIGESPRCAYQWSGFSRSARNQLRALHVRGYLEISEGYRASYINITDAGRKVLGG